MKGKLLYVYILKCSDGSYYTGLTNSLETRLKEHHAGRGTLYTSARLPVRLVYTEQFSARWQAECRELQLKSWSRLKKEALINCDLGRLKELSRSRD